MKASNVYIPDWFQGREVVELTPSASWHGGKQFIGKKQQAVLIDGSYFDNEGALFVIGEGHWELVT